MHYPGPPATSLSVTIHSGRELPSGDFFKKGDPYVKLTLGGKDQKTTYKKGTSPIWEQTFTFAYANEPNLKLTLWDKDLIRSDYLANSDVALLPILTLPSRTFTGEVSLTTKKGKEAGYIKITVEFYPRPEDGSQQQQPQQPLPLPQPQLYYPPYQQQQPPQFYPNNYLQYQQPYPTGYPQYPPQQPPYTPPYTPPSALAQPQYPPPHQYPPPPYPTYMPQ